MKKALLCITVFLISGIAALSQWDKSVISMRGRIALQDGKFASAIENFNVIARLDTTDYWNYFYRGIAKYNLGDIRGAQKDFDRTIRLNPIFTNGYHYRAITQNRFGRYEEALSDLEQAINLRPGYDGLYFTRGVTFFLAQRFDEALGDFNTYIAHEPKDASAYLNRGATYLFLRDTTRALGDYNRAIKLDRMESEGYIRRGRVYAEMKDYDQAIGDMTKAIQIDSNSTLAYFTRAVMYHEKYDYNAAMRDFNKILEIEPGNALTLYNRSLLYAQVGDFNSALADINRVIEINPDNVLAHYNRAAYYIELNKLQEAIDDYSRAIALYPDFAKAYMNRSSVELMLGRTAASKSDYQTAKRKIAEYKERNRQAEGSYADTTRKYNRLLTFDSDFSKKEFNDELLQNRDIDVKLRPLFKFVISDKANENLAFSNRFENVLLDRFIKECPVHVDISETISDVSVNEQKLEQLLAESKLPPSTRDFLRGIAEVYRKNYNRALMYFDSAVHLADSDVAKDKYMKFYKAFFLLNRGALRAGMADFLSNMGSNVQTLSMDDKGTIRTKVSDKLTSGNDYSDAISDMEEAVRILPDLPFGFFNLANLYCLSSRHVEAIDNYTKAVRLYPAMGEAYYNRALVLILVKDREKGCIDLSKAGELGIHDAYGLISKYCGDEED